MCLAKRLVLIQLKPKDTVQTKHILDFIIIFSNFIQTGPRDILRHLNMRITYITELSTRLLIAYTQRYLVQIYFDYFPYF